MSIVYDRAWGADPEETLRSEWLEANGLGGYASSTLSGAHSRRYHGLLVAATRPPAGRMVLLSKLDETIVVEGERFDLGCNRFPGAIHPRGADRLVSFSRDLFPVFEYEAGGVRLRKTVACVHGENTTIVFWELLEAERPFVLELRPFVAFRDHHRLAQANETFDASEATFEDGIFRARPYAGVPDLYLSVPGAEFEAAPTWYRRFEYAREIERGLDVHEDLFSHGVFRVDLGAVRGYGAIASTGSPAGRDAARLLEQERRRRAKLVAGLRTDDALARHLALSADRFVVRRGEDQRTLVAGYPWFAEWGRDTLLALPGVCLATGRLDDAKRILRAYARAESQGMIPSRFPESPGDDPAFDAADAALWLFVATHEYVEAGGDAAFVKAEILPLLRDVVAWHERGTRHGIREDEAGLLRACSPSTPLTWMDAKAGDWVVTPREGRPVELQALWYNARSILAALSRRFGDEAEAKRLEARAKRTRAAFEKAFWNEEAGCLHDVVGDGSKDASLRPNQILALSLPFPLLGPAKAKRVLSAVEERLATPFGLRSLAPDDPAYRGRYEGDVFARDGAYHRGSVFPWLLGPWAVAVSRFGTAASKGRVRDALEAIGRHVTGTGGGNVPELFDGDEPHEPRGCTAHVRAVGGLLAARAALAPAVAGKVRAKDPEGRKRAARGAAGSKGQSRGRRQAARAE